MTTRYNDSSNQEIRSMVYDILRQEESKFVYQQQQGASQRKLWETLKRIDILNEVIKRMIVSL